MTFQTFVSRRVRAAVPSPSRDASVAVILFFMMTLVFAPVIGMHLVAAFAPASLQSTVLSRSADPATPPG